MYPFKEDALQAVWQRMAFDWQKLYTNQGQALKIFSPGILNRGQGPDFDQAHLQIGPVAWHGKVEIHLSSRDWYRHRHHCDPGYDGVILHVVFRSEGIPIKRHDGTLIPEISLEGRMELPKLATSHRDFSPLPCAPFTADISDELKLEWVEALAYERMLNKVKDLEERLAASHGNWSQVFWEMLLRSLGGPVNGESLERLAQEVRAKTIHPYLDRPLLAEAMLLGVAGLLDAAAKDDYQAQLAVQWEFLKQKHRLSVLSLPIHYLRMRPAAFPEVRMSQGLQLLRTYPDWLALLDPDGWSDFLSREIPCSPYWELHTKLGQPRQLRKKHLGVNQKYILLINLLVPLGYLYAHAHQALDVYDWISHCLEAIPAEKNRIVRRYTDLGFPLHNALHSQGLLQLHKAYCAPGKCLSCRIGQEALNLPRNPSVYSPGKEVGLS
ncbi:MAG: DUF2851 family protein [Bacteroidota bacterium]